MWIKIEQGVNAKCGASYQRVGKVMLSQYDMRAQFEPRLHQAT